MSIFEEYGDFNLIQIFMRSELIRLTVELKYVTVFDTSNDSFQTVNMGIPKQGNLSEYTTPQAPDKEYKTLNEIIK